MSERDELERVRQWLEEAPFDDAEKLRSNPEFSYEDWFVRGRELDHGVERLIEILDRERLEMPSNENFGAAYALGWIGDSSAVPALLRAHDAPDPLVRMEAVAALGRVGGPEVVPQVLSRLEDGEEDPDVRANAAIALGNLGAVDAEPALRRAAEDEDEFVAAAANEGLRLLEASRSQLEER